MGSKQFNKTLFWQLDVNQKNTLGFVKHFIDSNGIDSMKRKIELEKKLAREKEKVDLNITKNYFKNFFFYEKSDMMNIQHETHLND
jgi:hypothetical protein